jgi:hypothetical protein
MSQLSEYLVEELLKESEKVTDYVVVYSGRFQPFHKGHYATYEHLVKKFGKNNVFIGTSDKTDTQKSPFNFREKKIIMTKMFGIPSNKIVQVKNPYAPMEILKNYDEVTTALITVVGEKDEQRLGGKYFTPYKGSVDAGYMDKGYVYASPAQPNPISGTDVRKWLGSGETEERKKLFTKVYPKFDQRVFDLITKKLDTLNEDVIVETSISSRGGDGEGEPETGYVSDGQKRVLNGGKPEPWFKQGGYKQMEVPKGDYMRGKGKSTDKDSQFRKVYYKIKNVETSTLKTAEKPEGVDKWKAVKPNKKNIIKKDKRYWEMNESQNQIISNEEINQIADEMVESLGLAMGYPSKEQLAQKQKERDVLRKKMDSQDNYYEKIDEKVEGGLADGLSLNDIAKKHNVSIGELTDEFKKGYTVEREHTSDTNVAKEIALDHLFEDPKYYTKLASIENVNEEIKLDVEIGDTVLMGKFKNKKVVVKSIGKDEHGMPTINGKKVATFRIIKRVNIFNNESTINEIPMGDLEKIDTYADKQLNPMDVVITDKHFFDRLSDPRNGKEISAAELTGFFKRLGKNKKKFVEFLKQYGQLVAKDKRTNINIPFMQKANKLIAKTIMRNDDYKTTNQIYKFEATEDSVLTIKKSLGVNRAQMPQINSKDLKDYLEFLKEVGVKVSAKTINVSKVGMTQKEINIDKVKGLLGTDRNNLAKPVIISNDGYILDGHHRVVALYNIDKNFKLKTIEVDLGIKDLLKVTKEYPNVSYKGINEYVRFNTLHTYPAVNHRGLGMNDDDLEKLEKKQSEKTTERINSKTFKPDTESEKNFLKQHKNSMSTPNIGYPSELDTVDFDDTGKKGGYQSNDKDTEDRGYEPVKEAFTKGQLFAGKMKVGGKPVNVEVELVGADDKNKQFITRIIYADKGYEKQLSVGSTLPIPARIFRTPGGGWRKIKTPSVFESVLTEGGAYGHMAHPFDVQMNLTFGDLKNIVKKALTGDLEVAREKTDGQALAISWVNGRLVAARNKSHLKNKGAEAMTIGQVADKFGGRGGLTDAYNFAMQDLSKAIGALSEPQKKKIFKDGACFMNLEVIYPTSVNVIPYNQPLLVFHGTMEYNDDGIAIGEDQQAAKILAGMIKQVNQQVQSKYTIQGPPMQKLPKNENLSKLQPKYMGMISKLQNEFGLSDNQGVSEYHQAWWTDFVNKNAKSLDAQQKIALVKRWAFYDKSFRINTIQDLKIRAWADGVDKKDHSKIAKDNLMRFEEIFLGVGAEVLSFMTSVLTANPAEATKQMVDRLKKTIDDVNKLGDPKKIEKLKLELQRLQALGGFDKIVPNEGIVFVYNGSTYKLTGAFAPLNQILGLFYEK